MAITISKYYWRCQMAGWGFVLLAQGICCSILGGLFERCIVMVITGLLVTHILRNIFVRQEWLCLPLVKGLPGLFLATLFACIGAGIVEDLLCAGIFGKIRVADQFFLSPGIILIHSMNMGLVICPWSLIYFSYHFIRKVQQGQQEMQRLEQRLKNMQLQFGERRPEAS